MNKTIIGFIAGQLLQLLILVVALMLTYSTNTLLFCAIFGAASTLILMIGVMLERFEQIQKGEDEVAPLPEEIVVTNDHVERKTEEAKVAALFGRKK